MIVRELITKLGFQVDNNNLRKYEQGINGLQYGVNSLGHSFSNLKSIIAGVVGAFGVNYLKNLGASLLQTAGEVEQYRVTLGTMIGDQEKANKLIHDLDYSAVSDFYGTASTIGGFQGLVTFGMQAEEAKDSLERLGDIAQGNTEAFKSLSLNLGQVFAKGKADGMDIKQFVTQGFDVVGEISKMTGQSRDEIEEAGVTYDLVAKALKNITDEGGKYNGMLQKQSNTFPGLIKRFISLKMAIKESIGFNLFETAKGILSHLYDTVKNLQERIVEVGTRFFEGVGAIISYIIAAIEMLAVRTKGFAGVRSFISSLISHLKIIFGIIAKIAIFLVPVLDKILFVLGAILMPIITIIFLAKKVIAVIKIVNTLVMIFNMISAMNPFSLILIGIVALVVALIALVTVIIFNWEKVKGWFVKFFSWVKDGFTKLFASVKSIFSSIGSFFSSIWENIGNFFQGAIDSIVDAWSNLAMFFDTLWQVVKTIFLVFITWVGGIWGNVIDTIKNVWGGLVGFFENLWEKVFGGFNSFIENIKSGVDKIQQFLGLNNDVNMSASSGLVGATNSYANSIYSNSSPNTVHSNANITVNVPVGSSAEQARAISEQVQKEINNAWVDVINGSRANIPSPEARGF